MLEGNNWRLGADEPDPLKDDDLVSSKEGHKLFIIVKVQQRIGAAWAVVSGRVSNSNTFLDGEADPLGNVSAEDLVVGDVRMPEELCPELVDVVIDRLAVMIGKCKECVEINVEVLGPLIFSNFFLPQRTVIGPKSTELQKCKN